MFKWILGLALALSVISCASKEGKKAEEMAETEGKKMEASADAEQPGTPSDADDAKEAGEAEGKKMAADASKVTCTLNSDVRTLSNQGAEDGGCEVAYEKNGETNVVATAKSDLEHCGRVVTRIQERLTAAGFTCE